MSSVVRIAVVMSNIVYIYPIAYLWKVYRWHASFLIMFIVFTMIASILWHGCNPGHGDGWRLNPGVSGCLIWRTYDYTMATTLTLVLMLFGFRPAIPFGRYIAETLLFSHVSGQLILSAVDKVGIVRYLWSSAHVLLAGKLRKSEFCVPAGHLSPPSTRWQKFCLTTSIIFFIASFSLLHYGDISGTTDEDTEGLTHVIWHLLTSIGIIVALPLIAPMPKTFEDEVLANPVPSMKRVRAGLCLGDGGRSESEGESESGSEGDRDRGRDRDRDRETGGVEPKTDSATDGESDGDKRGSSAVRTFHGEKLIDVDQPRDRLWEEAAAGSDGGELLIRARNPAASLFDFGDDSLTTRARAGERVEDDPKLGHQKKHARMPPPTKASIVDTRGRSADEPEPDFEPEFERDPEPEHRRRDERLWSPDETRQNTRSALHRKSRPRAGEGRSAHENPGAHAIDIIDVHSLDWVKPDSLPDKANEDPPKRKKKTKKKKKKQNKKAEDTGTETGGQGEQEGRRDKKDPQQEKKRMRSEKKAKREKREKSRTGPRFRDAEARVTVLQDSTTEESVDKSDAEVPGNSFLGKWFGGKRERPGSREREKTEKEEKKKSKKKKDDPLPATHAFAEPQLGVGAGRDRRGARIHTGGDPDRNLFGSSAFPWGETEHVRRDVGSMRTRKTRGSREASFHPEQNSESNRSVSGRYEDLLAI